MQCEKKLIVWTRILNDCDRQKVKSIVELREMFNIASRSEQCNAMHMNNAIGTQGIWTKQLRSLK